MAKLQGLIFEKQLREQISLTVSLRQLLKFLFSKGAGLCWAQPPRPKVLSPPTLKLAFWLGKDR